MSAQAGSRAAGLRGLGFVSETPKAVAILAIAAAFSCLGAGAVQAGAWPLEQGKTQVIAKHERMRATRGYNLDGALVAIDARRDDTLSVFVEHGLTPSLTLQAKAGLARGEDRWVDYSGRGPLELGLRWTARRTDRSSLAVYLGAADPGEGRNAGYAAPGQGTLDLEARLLYGRSGVWRGRKVYVDLQAARVQRQGLADENRFDATFGFKPNDHWELLAQTNAGRADHPVVRARWLKTEFSVVRAYRDWSLHAGWRDTVSGRETARDRGVVLAVWRRL